MGESHQTWTEADSRTFLDLADVAVPGRKEQMEMLLSLVPAQPNEAFLGADICCGEGLLASRLLERFPRAHLIALDGAPLMLERAQRRLARFGGRAEVHEFDLDSPGSLSELPGGLRCISSSLALHHIHGESKQRLFRDLSSKLEAGGALLIADIVEPTAEIVHQAFDAEWDRAAREQSLALTGSLDLYQRAVDEGWAPGEEQSTEEMPSRLYEQLKWLEEAGFSAVDCFWMRAGVAVYGGYR